MFMGEGAIYILGKSEWWVLDTRFSLYYRANRASQLYTTIHPQITQTSALLECALAFTLASMYIS